jgi:hypothetical protein
MAAADDVVKVVPIDLDYKGQGWAMPLKMRPTGLGHGVYKDVPDYGIFCGEWCIGRIYETRTGPESLRWFWALHAPGGRETLRASNQVAVLEIAKAEFETSWKQWKAWAGLKEVE